MDSEVDDGCSDIVLVEDIAKVLVVHKPPDWDGIQLEWCAAIKSERQLALDYKTPRSTIAARAKKEGWTKNLTERVKVEREKQLAIRAAKEKRLNDGAEGVISSAAELQVSVVLRHRADIGRLAVIVEANLEELGEQRNEKFVIVLKDRVSFADTTAKTLRALTVMEREAHGIGVDKEGEIATHESMMQWYKDKEA